MKLLGILWNSIGDKRDEAIEDIKRYGNVSFCDVDFGSDYRNFLLDMYPFNESEKWKAEFKVNGLVDKYKNNSIRIIIIDIPKVEKVYLKNKDKMMYKNVLELKVFIRKKYEGLVIENTKTCGKSYDNIFHMTDDEQEYEENLPVILDYLSRHLDLNGNLMSISEFIDESLLKIEDRGTRKKYWITNNLLFKENSENTFENYSEIFNMYFMKLFGLNNSAKYKLFRSYEKAGVLTKRINGSNEEIIFLDKILNEYEFIDKKDLINHNSLEELPIYLSDYCKRHNLILDESYFDELRKLFLYDILTCQNDRNPTNMCLKYDINTRIAKLYYFDNSNMLFFYKPEILLKYSENNLNINEYLENNTSTFLLNKSDDLDICFNNKLLHLDSFLCNSQNIQTFNDFCELYTIDNINLTFKIIEQNENINLPSLFKKAILEYSEIIIYRLQEIKNKNNSILKLKSSK